MKGFLNKSVLLLVMIALHSCGKKVANTTQALESSNGDQEQETPTFTSSIDGATTASYRICTDKLLNPFSTTAPNPDFEEFTHTKIENLEGDPTVCLRTSGSGDDLRVMFRVEWEDNVGIRVYPDHYAGSAFRQDRTQLFYADLDPAATEIILIDIEGFISLTGAVNTTSGLLELDINYVDIVPFERDSNEEPILDSNGNPTLVSHIAGHNPDQCATGELLDSGSNPVPGYQDVYSLSDPQPCSLVGHIYHGFFGFNFSLVPTNYTPRAILPDLVDFWSTSPYTGDEQAVSDNYLAIIRQYLDPSNNTDLQSLNVRQGTLGSIAISPF